LGPTGEELVFLTCAPEGWLNNSKRIGKELENCLIYLFVFLVSEEDPDEYVWLDDPEANFQNYSRIERIN